MSLPSASPRQPIHTRSTSCSTFLRADGLWEAEGRLVDTRGYDFVTRARGTVRQGEPIHDMTIRIVFDGAMVIRDIAVATDAAPYLATCAKATPNYQRLIGLRLDQDFIRSSRQHVGGSDGCTHHNELLRALHIVATRTYYTHVMKTPGSGTDMEGQSEEAVPLALADTCYGLASDGEIAPLLWPDRAAGPQQR